MTTLNTPLLSKIKQHILEEPERLRMDTWLTQDAPGAVKHISIPGYGEPENYVMPPCGTVGCIVGWAVMLTHPDLASDDPFAPYEERGRVILGIDPDYEPYSLFYVDYWPMRFRDMYREAETIYQRAVIVCQVIDHYVDGYVKRENDPDTMYSERPDDEDES